MPALPSSYRHEELRIRLSRLAEALFSRAARLNGPLFETTATPLAGTDIRLLSLCRSIGAADKVLQQLIQQWPSLAGDTQVQLREAWDSRLLRLLQEVTGPCPACNTVTHDCIECGHLLPSAAERLDVLAGEIAEQLAAEGGDTMGQEGEIRRLENELQSKSEELQKAIINNRELDQIRETATADMLAAQQECDRTYQNLEEVLQRLDDVTKTITECAEDLEKGGRWEMAADAYGALHRIKEYLWRRQTERVLPETDISQLKIDSVLLQHKQVSALMHVEKYPAAKLLELARAAWEAMGCKGWAGKEEKNLLLPATRSEVRQIHEDYCNLLRWNRQYEDAEREYMFVWYCSDRWCIREPNDEWRYNLAYQIGMVMAEQRRYEEAAVWHKKVVDWALSMNPKHRETAARSALELLAERENLKQSQGQIIEMLTSIWTAEGSSNQDVLACGHEHGHYLLDQAQYANAALVLKEVWDRRKDTGHPDALVTAELLVVAWSRLENNRELEKLYTWVIGKLPVDKKLKSIRYRYALGHVQFILENTDAESTLRQALNELEHHCGNEDCDTLQCGLLLGQVLMKKGNHQEARKFFQAAWDGRRDPKTVLVVRAGEFYSDALMHSEDSNDLKQAKDVLEELWKMTLEMSSDGTALDRESVLWPALLSAGDCFYFLLEKQKMWKEAAKVLDTVVKLKKDLGFEPSEIEESERWLKAAQDKADERFREKPKDGERRKHLPDLDPTRQRSQSRSRSHNQKYRGTRYDLTEWLAVGEAARMGKRPDSLGRR